VLGDVVEVSAIQMNDSSSWIIFCDDELRNALKLAILLGIFLGIRIVLWQKNVAYISSR